MTDPLPHASGSLAASTAAALRDASLGIADRRILVVDDEEMNVRVVRRMLIRAGFESVEALSDAREVLPVVAAAPPALLLLDVHMPYHDGFAVLQQLRDRHDGRLPCPVLLFTGDGVAGLWQRAEALGVRGFIGKPFDMRDALATIRGALHPGQDAVHAA